MVRWLTFTRAGRRQSPPVPLFPSWERLERLARWLLRLLLALAILVLLASIAAALVQANVFGLGNWWALWWPYLEPVWRPWAPGLAPWMRLLQPLLDGIKALLALVGWI